MFLRHLQTFLIVLGVLTGTDGQNASTIERISFLLERFCPGEGICLSNRTVQQSAEPSCCSGCSCDDACHPSMNCCFPKLAGNSDIPETLESPTVNHFSKLAGTNDIPETLESPTLNHSTCLYPFAPIINDDQKISANSYRMISSEDNTDHTESCGNQIVAPWGSLFPVYSKQKDLIFKNSACAKAYNVEDGMLWEAYLICKINTPNAFLLNDGATFTVSSGTNISDDCNVYFQYPEHELRAHVCYVAEDFINTCPTSRFRIPSTVNMDKQEIVTACTSGLVAPYKQNAMFANVFCFICNKQMFPQHRACSHIDVIVQQSNSNTAGFVGLLSTNYLLPQKTDGAKRTIRLACPRTCNEVSNKTCCREILCPSGKSRNYDGNCYFPTDRWYNTEYEVAVNLTAPHDINVHQLFTVRNQNNVWKRTWPNNWYVHEVYNEMKGNMTRNILVTIKIPFAEGSPQTLILNIKKVMRRQWGLYVDNQLIPLKASFSKLKYIYRFTSTQMKETTIVIAPNVTKVVALPAVRSLHFYGRVPARMQIFCINKLYYCEQVELHESEYEMFDSFIYNKLTGQLVLNGEYTLVNRGGISVLRVCLDTSGLMESSGNRNACTIIWVILTTFVITG